MIIQQTERLFLRQFHIIDQTALNELFSDPEVMRFGDGPQSAEWVQEWIARARRNYQQWGFGAYAVVDKAQREVIGYCGLTYFPDINGKPEVEIGYRLVRRVWGQGYATEAASAIRDYATETLCITRLIALIDPENSASLGVATKLGMHKAGEVMLEGYTHPDYVYLLES